MTALQYSCYHFRLSQLSYPSIYFLLVLYQANSETYSGLSRTPVEQVDILIVVFDVVGL